MGTWRGQLSAQTLTSKAICRAGEARVGHGGRAHIGGQDSSC